MTDSKTQDTASISESSKPAAAPQTGDGSSTPSDLALDASRKEKALGLRLADEGSLSRSLMLYLAGDVDEDAVLASLRRSKVDLGVAADESKSFSERMDATRRQSIEVDRLCARQPFVSSFMPSWVDKTFPPPPEHVEARSKVAWAGGTDRTWVEATAKILHPLLSKDLPVAEREAFLNWSKASALLAISHTKASLQMFARAKRSAQENETMLEYFEVSCVPVWTHALECLGRDHVDSAEDDRKGKDARDLAGFATVWTIMKNVAVKDCIDENAGLPAWVPEFRQKTIDRLDAAVGRAHDEAKALLRAGEPTAGRAPPMHVVVRGQYASSKNHDISEDLRRFACLQSPLPVTPLPAVVEIDRIHEVLQAEFPWCTKALKSIFSGLRMRSLFGAPELALEPVLFLGPSGCGKTRLGKRMAELFSMPYRYMDLAGADSFSLRGLTRGWASAHPSPVVQFLATNRTASGMLYFDEVDKARPVGRDVSVLDVALSMIEPDSTKNWPDPYLQTPVNLSKVVFWAAANSLTQLSAPFKKRFHIIEIPRPGIEQLRATIPTVVADIASSMLVPAGAMPLPPESIITSQVGDMRTVKQLVQAWLQDWSSSQLHTDPNRH